MLLSSEHVRQRIDQISQVIRIGFPEYGAFRCHVDAERTGSSACDPQNSQHVGIADRSLQERKSFLRKLRLCGTRIRSTNFGALRFLERYAHIAVDNCVYA